MHDYPETLTDPAKKRVGVFEFIALTLFGPSERHRLFVIVRSPKGPPTRRIRLGEHGRLARATLVRCRQRRLLPRLPLSTINCDQNLSRRGWTRRQFNF